MQRMPPPPFPCVALTHNLCINCFLSPSIWVRGAGAAPVCSSPAARGRGAIQRVGTSPRALNCELCEFPVWPNPSRLHREVPGLE